MRFLSRFVSCNRQNEIVVDDYLSRQREVTPSMRAILVDWLVELQETFEVSHESLYMAVRIVDLYLAKAQTTKARLQLVGATSLFIACKMEVRLVSFLPNPNLSLHDSFYILTASFS